MQFGSKQQYTSSGNYLEGGKIHTVKFSGITPEIIKGKTGEIFNIINITFENESGTFTHKIFEPKSDGRGQYPNMPSAEEETQYFIAHIASVICPEFLEAMENKNPSWGDVGKYLKKFSDPMIGTEYKIKLMLRKDKNTGKVYPDIPRVAAVAKKDGAIFMANQFVAKVGAVLDFSEYELKRIRTIKMEAMAVPTESSNISNSIQDSITSEVESPNFTDDLPINMDI